MKQYHELVRHVLTHGAKKEDRTGTGTISLFGMQQRYDLRTGFPAVTTKKLAWKSVVSELLWFIEGSGDETRLREILHGSRHSDKSTIWTEGDTHDPIAVVIQCQSRLTCNSVPKYQSPIGAR